MVSNTKYGYVVKHELHFLTFCCAHVCVQVCGVFLETAKVEKGDIKLYQILRFAVREVVSDANKSYKVLILTTNMWLSTELVRIKSLINVSRNFLSNT